MKVTSRIKKLKKIKRQNPTPSQIPKREKKNEKKISNFSFLLQTENPRKRKKLREKA